MGIIGQNLATKFLSTTILSVCVNLCIIPMALSNTAALLANTGVPLENRTPENLPNFSRLMEQSGPAVVNIRTTQKVIVDHNASSSRDEDELFRQYFGVPNPHSKKKSSPKDEPSDSDEEISSGIGSGFIFSSDGYLLTNAHVVKNADEVFVTLTDKREFKARIIGADTNTDIAVLKIDGNDLPKVHIGNSQNIKVGEWVIAIGSPFDLDNSITAGIISAKAREIGDFLLLIQTDVAINPGNSGGPLINMQGDVVGINSQIYSRSGGYMGISFAIPINDAIQVAEQLKTYGKITRGRMGIYLADVNRDVAQALKLPSQSGALISRVEKDGPAQQAGVLDGDIVLKFNSTNIEKSTELRRLAAAAQPGSKVSLTVWRKGSINEISVKMAELPSNYASVSNEKKQHNIPEEKNNNKLGLEVKPLTTEQKTLLNISSGVLIENAHGAAARAGLQADDVILAINNKDINNEKELNKWVSQADSNSPFILLAKRGDVTQYIAIHLVQ